MDATGINVIDSTATQVLADVVRAFKEKTILFLLANVKGRVRDSLEICGLTEVTNPDPKFFDGLKAQT